jgi:branched-chain amino acid transport system ATP-binding protein
MMLSLANMAAGYGRGQVLFDVSISLAAGEVVVLLGRNGAGKTTTLKTAIGLLPCLSGEIKLGDEAITQMPTHNRVLRGLAYVPEDRRIFTDLTVSENLEVGTQAARAGAPTWTRERVLDLFPKLKEMLTRPGGQMSGGEQQMLTIARSLLGNPRVLLLDEPSEGLAPVIVERIAEAILALKREGLAILLSEQNYHFAQLVSDRAYVLELGHVRFAGDMAALRADDTIRQRFLSV